MSKKYTDRFVYHGGNQRVAKLWWVRRNM